MRLDEILAELMVQVAPSLYCKYVTSNAKGNPILYVQLEKTVYDMMKSALPFYRKLIADLKSLGYEINPYDTRVANKTINGKQMTICWHVDDLFVGHEDPTVITNLLRWLTNRYDTADKKLNITRGHRHDYLGMTIDFSNKAVVAFDMIPFINKIFTAFPEKIQGCLRHLRRIIYSMFVHQPKPNSFLKNKLVLFIIQWHKSYFFLEFNVTSKLLLHS